MKSCLTEEDYQRIVEKHTKTSKMPSVDEIRKIPGLRDYPKIAPIPMYGGRPFLGVLTEEQHKEVKYESPSLETMIQPYLILSTNKLAGESPSKEELKYYRDIKRIAKSIIGSRHVNWKDVSEELKERCVTIR